LPSSRSPTNLDACPTEFLNTFLGGKELKPLGWKTQLGTALNTPKPQKTKNKKGDQTALSTKQHQKQHTTSTSRIAGAAIS
jgi:hypothetical protein